MKKILRQQIDRVNVIIPSLEKAAVTASSKEEHHVTRKAAMARKMELTKEADGLVRSMRGLIDEMPDKLKVSDVERLSFEIATALRRSSDARPERIIQQKLCAFMGVNT